MAAQQRDNWYGYRRNILRWLWLFIWVAGTCLVHAQEHKDQWYKNSFIYNIEVGTFKDSDGDGVGDFKGLVQQLGYLDSLGVDVLWLAPFHPSPGGDDGYDVTDYYSVNPK